MLTDDKLPPDQQTGRPAGFFTRLEAFVIDLLLIVVGTVAAIALFELILKFFILPFTRFEWSRGAYSQLILFMITVVYFSFFWWLLGFTPGKFLLGLRVIRQDGRRLGIVRSIIRFFCYWISAIPLFMGFIWIIFDSKRQGWHDKLVNTQVIYTWEKPPKK